MEIATNLHPDDEATKQFLESGWSLVEVRPLNTPWQRYRDYLAQSRGEFCVAKDPARHARAAREIAERYCSAPVVVNQFLETIGR